MIKTSGSGSSSYTEREEQVWAIEPEDLGKLNGELILITLQDSSASKRQHTIGMNKAVLAYSIRLLFDRKLTDFLGQFWVTPL